MSRILEYVLILVVAAMSLVYSTVAMILPAAVLALPFPQCGSEHSSDAACEPILLSLWLGLSILLTLIIVWMTWRHRKGLFQTETSAEPMS